MSTVNPVPDPPVVPIPFAVVYPVPAEVITAVETSPLAIVIVASPPDPSPLIGICV